MTRRLILMRHAKSSWASPQLTDHERPLNGRGRRSAAALGGWLRMHDYLPGQILSSSSVRTRETCAHLNLTADAAFLDRLYHADAPQMMRVLQGASAPCVLMLGHNPGIAWLAGLLVSAAPDHPRFDDYPTCATLVADFPIQDWRDLAPATGLVENFVIPRDLAVT